MNLLRDPLWQFVGVVIAIFAAAIPIVASTKRRKVTKRNEEQATPSERNPQVPRPATDNARHKKRKPDGVLAANISSDFLNQFPSAIGTLASHLDRPYTPENFGSSDWLSVFRRLILEGYFSPTDGTRPSRITLETPVRPGPKLVPWLEGSAAMKRRILGLD